MQKVEEFWHKSELENDRRKKEEREKWIQEHTFKYKNTTFEIDVNWNYFKFDDNIDDAMADRMEKKLIKQFVDKKDEIIELALESAVKNELQTAKEWAKDWEEDPDTITEQVFIKNLLRESFIVQITGTKSYEIVFSTNDMFTDHSLICEIKNGECTDVSIEG